MDLHDLQGPTPSTPTRGANRFVIDLAEAAEERGYQLVAIDLSRTWPSVRLQDARVTIELSTEYGAGLEDLIAELPRANGGPAT